MSNIDGTFYESNPKLYPYEKLRSNQKINLNVDIFRDQFHRFLFNKYKFKSDIKYFNCFVSKLIK